MKGRGLYSPLGPSAAEREGCLGSCGGHLCVSEHNGTKYTNEKKLIKMYVQCIYIMRDAEGWKEEASKAIYIV